MQERQKNCTTLSPPSNYIISILFYSPNLEQITLHGSEDCAVSLHTLGTSATFYIIRLQYVCQGGAMESVPSSGLWQWKLFHSWDILCLWSTDTVIPQFTHLPPCMATQKLRKSNFAFTSHSIEKYIVKKISINLKFYTIKPCYTNFFEQGLRTA